MYLLVHIAFLAGIAIIWFGIPSGINLPPFFSMAVASFVIGSILYMFISPVAGVLLVFRAQRDGAPLIAAAAFEFLASIFHVYIAMPGWQ